MDIDQNEWIEKMSAMAASSSLVDSSLYAKYDVKRGLRDIKGKGVLAGLTQIGEVQAHTQKDDRESELGPGCLIYRGIDITEIVSGFMADKRSGFEEICYLLLFGELPDKDELRRFQKLLISYRRLPEFFIHDSILKLSSRDIMNAIAQSILSLYVLDERADDTDIPNVLRQCIQLIAAFPSLVVYCYQAHAYCYGNQSLIIHNPGKQLSTAGNFLHMLRHDSEFTALEEKLLDLSLVLHAEHGGGNNSAFSIHVVSSSDTDTYSAVAAAVGSLKGTKHGGANVKVVEMIDNIKENVPKWSDKGKLADYLRKILRKEVYDRTGLIYGIGHAVYTLSDPRAVLLKEKARKLAELKGLEAEFQLYDDIEKLTPEVFGSEKKSVKIIAPNVDFYSGFVYRMLDLNVDLYTPIFAISRIAGWSAHRLEEIISGGRIIRPAYKHVSAGGTYIPLEMR